MSKSFPGSPRKYDLYLAAPEELGVGRVLFNPHGRFVIRETYSREDWEKERALQPEPGPGRLMGVFECDDKPLAPDNCGLRPADFPVDLKFFYGADYL